MEYTIIQYPSEDFIARFSSLRKNSNSGDDSFIAEGEKVVSRLVRSDLEIISLYLTQTYFNSINHLLHSHHQRPNCNICIAPKIEMEKIVGFSLHQGILAAARIPKGRTLYEVIATSNKPLLLVILDEIGDAENIGAIFRSSLAMNASAIITDKKSTSPWMRRAVRVSMGAVFKMPIVTVDSIRSCIEKLKQSGITTFATTLSENAKPIWDCNFRKDIAIVFGSEGHGIRQEIIDACDEEVSIPMPENSLNVGIAQGIFLYEVLRHRTV